MRLTPWRALTAYLPSGVCIAGIAAAAALTTSHAALAATSSLCEPLPSTATPSPTASTQAELCVSVQTSQSSIKSGQAASYTVQVWAVNGSASGVSVTLTGSPAGEAPDFTGRCPSGDGSATCTIGALATPIAPSTYQMSAQIPVAAGATSVTSVTLTATADAATSPAMTVLPTAAETVAVSAPTPAASTPAASASPPSTPSPVAAPTTVPAVVATPTTTAIAHPIPGSASTSLISPVGAANVLPPVATTPVVVTAPGSAAATSASSSGNFTLVVTAATAERVGFIVLGLVLLLTATRLGRQWLAAGRAQKQGGSATRQRRFWPPWPLRRRRAAPGETSQDATTEALAEDTDSVAAHSGADPRAEHQS